MIVIFLPSRSQARRHICLRPLAMELSAVVGEPRGALVLLPVPIVPILLGKLVDCFWSP
jgi:hypothetical protein